MAYLLPKFRCVILVHKSGVCTSLVRQYSGGLQATAHAACGGWWNVNILTPISVARLILVHALQAMAGAACRRTTMGRRPLFWRGRASAQPQILTGAVFVNGTFSRFHNTLSEG